MLLHHRPCARLSCLLLAQAGLASSALAQFEGSCTTAPSVGLGTYTFNLASAPESFTSPCARGGREALASQWVRFVSPGGPIEISTVGLTTGDTIVSVHSINSNDPELNCGFAPFQVDQCNDDAAGTEQSRVRFNSFAGPYLVRVSGASGGASISGSVAITTYSPAQGDSCSNPLVATSGVNTFDPTSTVINSFASCSGFRDVYFTYTPPVSGALTLSTSACTPFTAPTFSVLSVCGGSLLACSPYTFCATGSESVVAGTAVEAGVPVIIRVTDDSAPGPSQFTLALDANGIPSNDTCETATVIGLGDTIFDNTYATTQEPGGCPAAGGFPFDAGNDLFFSFTPSVSGVYDFSTGASTGISDTQLAISEGCLFSPFVCNDNAIGFRSFIRTTLTSGVTYVIRVSGAGLPDSSSPIDRGLGVLSIRQSIAPANDTCAGATTITVGTSPFDLFDATTGTQAAPCISTGLRHLNDVWYRYIPTSNGPVEANVSPLSSGPSFPATLTLFESCEGSTGAESASLLYDGMTGGTLPRIIAQGQLGVPLFFRVSYELGIDQALPESGSGTITVTAPSSPSPSNDVCSAAIAVGNGTIPIDLTNSAKDCNVNALVFGSNPCQSATQNDIFYRYTAPLSATTVINIDDGIDYPNFAGILVSVSNACGDGVPLACSFGFGDAPKQFVAFDAVEDQEYIIRVASLLNSFPSVTTGSITINSVVCDSIDFNGDGLFPDDADLVDFLSVLAGGPCSTETCNDIDFNNDGLFPDDTDLISFLTVLAGGSCI